MLDAPGVLDTAWAPKGREGRSQAGPKGHQLEVLVFYIAFKIQKHM